MSKVQPAMFNLQASEKEMVQMIPQMLQVPFFFQVQDQQPNLMEDDLDDSFLTVRNTDEALANGNIRLAIPVDTAIYALLRSHCAKGARQAEELINTAMNNNYIPQQTITTMPPIFKFQSNRSKRYQSTSMNGSMLHAGRNQTKGEAKHISSSSLSAESSLSMGTTTTTSFSSLPRSDISDTNLASRKNSDEVTSSSTTHTPLSSIRPHPSMEVASSRTVTESPEFPVRKIESIEEEVEPSTPTLHPTLMKSLSNPRSRKTSTVTQPALQRPRGDSTGSDVSISEYWFVPGSHSWNTSIINNNTIIAQYGNTLYDLIWWDPAFKIDFRLSSSVGLLSGTVTGIDPSRPEVTLKVFNNSPKQVGFSIRSHRQSSAYSSHVVYPNKGLEILEPYKSWEDNVEFHPSSPSSLEMFVIDLFFCTMDAKPSWNVVRKYAIMKAHKRYV